MRRSLTRQERLRDRKEISRLFASGKMSSCRGLKLWVATNDTSETRVLMSPSRNFSGAVERNLVKRQGKEIFRHLKFMIKPGHDLIFLFYPGSYSYFERQEQILSLLTRNHLLIKS